jgi:hypothetical protein
MANFKQQAAKETRSPEEVAFQAAANSQYNVMTPMLDAKYVRIHHPLTGLDSHFATNDPKFFEMLKDFYSKGLEQKIQKEFSYFVTIDTKWFDVAKEFSSYLTSTSQGE